MSSGRVLLRDMGQGAEGEIPPGNTKKVKRKEPEKSIWGGKHKLT